MPIFQCNGCPTCPCILINPDPEFEPNDWCTRKPTGDDDTGSSEWQQLKVGGA